MRTIQTASVYAEDIGFPMAEQAARLYRNAQGRKPEEVCLVTNMDNQQLDAKQWLKLNRRGWGIENGLHQRLDVSHRDDECRIRNPNGKLAIGIFRRLVNSIFMQWRANCARPQYKTTTDFQMYMSSQGMAPAVRFVTSKRPKLHGDDP